MKLISLSFKFGYREELIGITVMQRIKSTFVNKYIYEKNTMGEFYNFALAFGNWFNFGDINVYLKSIRDCVEKGIHYWRGSGRNHPIKFEDLNDDQQFVVYRNVLTEVIQHEYYHYIFADLQLGLTPDQQHNIIKSILQFE